MNNLRSALVLALLVAGCGLRPPPASQHGDGATPVPIAPTESGSPLATARAYGTALFAGRPIEPWSTPGWAAEVALRTSPRGPAEVVVTGAVLEDATATTAKVTVTTDPPDDQLTLLLVLRSGAWLVRGHG